MIVCNRYIRNLNMLYCLCVSLVSLNGDDKPKEKTSDSESGDREGVSGGDSTTKEADGSLGGTTDKDGDSDSDDQQNVGENEGEERNLKRSRSADDPDHDNADSKRICLTPQ